MKSLIVGKCRETLSAADVAFILEATGNDANASVGLQALLCDEAERDHVLDDPALMHALLNQPGYLDISTQLFFYLVVRHSLRESSIDDRDVADYVASMLTAFASADRMLRPLPHKDFATEWSDELGIQHIGKVLDGAIGNLPVRAPRPWFRIEGTHL